MLKFISFVISLVFINLNVAADEAFIFSGQVISGQAASVIQKCGYAPETVLTQQVKTIFEEVNQRIKSKTNDIPQLAIVGSSKCNLSSARAYSDGYVIIPATMVEKIFHAGINKNTEAQMAFVIGHELAHIVMKIPGETLFFPEIIPEESISEIQKLDEYKADILGFVLAGISGYAVDEIIKDDNFFSKWSPHESGDNFDSTTHPPSKERTKNLLNVFNEIIEKIKFFKFGVRLSYFDKCEDAVYFLKKFRDIFPARETFNNVGYCFLTNALKKWGEGGYFYWLPMVLDFNTLADDFSVSRRSDFDKDKKYVVTKLLKEAKYYFKKAIESDPSYLPAYINLATTNFLSNESFSLDEANLNVLKAKAKAINSHNLELKMLEMLILYEQSKLKSDDLWANVVNELESLSMEYDTVPLSVTYNLARLYDQRGRVHKYWKQLAQQIDALPSPIDSIVCFENELDCSNQQKYPRPSKSWSLPEITKRRVLENKDYPQWNKIKFDFNWVHELQKFYAGAFFQHVDDNVEFMTLSSYPQLVVLKDVNVSPENLQDYCGSSLYSTVRDQERFEICSNQWIALVKNHVVKEVWVIPN